MKNKLTTNESFILGNEEEARMQSQFSLATEAAGIYLSGLDGFTHYNPAQADAHSQGLLETLHEVQGYCCKITGLAVASLAPSSSAQGIFACLSIIKKYHLRKKQRRNKILICGDMEGIPAAAEQAELEMETITLQQLEEKLDSSVAALVLPVPGLTEIDILPATLFAKIDELDILTYMEGSGCYFFPSRVIAGQFKPDIINLDLGQLCEIGPGCHAVVCSESLRNYLPAQLVQHKDNQFQLLTLNENPQSIGVLASNVGNIEFILRCYVQLRLKGINGVLQQAAKAVVSSLYLQRKLADAGFENACYCAQSSGLCCIKLIHSKPSMLALQEHLAPYRSTGLQITGLDRNDKDRVTIILSRLHYLTGKQLDSVVELLVKFV